MNDYKKVMVEFFMEKGMNYELAESRALQLIEGDLPIASGGDVQSIEHMTDTELQKKSDEMNAMRIKRLEMRLAKEKHETDQRIGKLETDVNKRMTIDYGQQQALLNAKNKRVEKLWAEDGINKAVHDTKKKVHARAWKDVKDAFGVSSYKDIREKDYEEAMNYVEAWRPRMV